MSIAEWDSAANDALRNSTNAPPPDATSGAPSSANGASVSANGDSHAACEIPCRPGKPLHRIADVRRQQGVSQRNVARQLNIELAIVRQQEEETSDLPLSALYEWQRVLEVPIAELLVDSDGPLSPPVMERARMVKVMKTVAAIVEKARSPSLKRLLQMLCNQLLEIMPELSDVAPWHSIGQRRTLEEYGRAVERQLPDDMFRRNGR